MNEFILALMPDLVRACRLQTANCFVIIKYVCGFGPTRMVDGSIHPMLHVDWLLSLLEQRKTDARVERVHYPILTLLDAKQKQINYRLLTFSPIRLYTS